MYICNVENIIFRIKKIDTKARSKLHSSIAPKIELPFAF